MKQTIETLHQRLRELHDDLSRIAKILDEHPESLNELRHTFQALNEAIKDVHAKLESELKSK